jgi:hypothetical protein
MDYQQQQQQPPQQMRGMPPQQMQQHMPLQQQGSGPAAFAQSPVAGGADPYGSNRALYVGNLANSVDETALQQAFGAFGPIMQIQVGRLRRIMCACAQRVWLARNASVAFA